MSSLEPIDHCISYFSVRTQYSGTQDVLQGSQVGPGWSGHRIMHQIKVKWRPIVQRSSSTNLDSARQNSTLDDGIHKKLSSWTKLDQTRPTQPDTARPSPTFLDQFDAPISQGFNVQASGLSTINSTTSSCVTAAGRLRPTQFRFTFLQDPSIEFV